MSFAMTVFSLNTGTKCLRKPEQTMIGLLMEEQSDHGLLCLPFQDSGLVFYLPLVWKNKYVKILG